MFKTKKDPPPSSHQQQYISNCDNAVRMRNNICPNKSRPLFHRKSGYQLVDTHEDSSYRPAPWHGVKSSTYSLLSNASTDSCAVDDSMSVEDSLSSMAQLSRPVHQLRSESAYNFPPPVPHLPSVPRSQTTARLNPFIRSETFTTSDYASDMGESSFAGSVIGIPNPVYDEFSNSNSCERDEDENHRNFALALNNSLTASNRRRPMRSSNADAALSQMVRLHAVAEPEGSVHSPSNEPHHPAQSEEEEEDDYWSVLTFGGREASHVTAFDRPLSIWMLRL